MSGRKGRKIPLGLLRGKSITTSVPSIAIRFHTGDEELELYPSADDEEDEDRDDDAGGGSSTSATPAASPTPAAPPSRDPSPMKEYFRGLGKRSTSVDGAIMDVGGGAPAGGSTHDTWRIFHELKGKITKTVEEKLTEMKNERKASATTTPVLGGKRARLRAGGVENSSISDSEDVSETSNKDDGNLPPTNAGGGGPLVRKTSSGRVKTVNFPAGQAAPETADADTPSTSAAGNGENSPKATGRGLLRKRKDKKKKKKKKGDGTSDEDDPSGTESDQSLPFETGVEINEETKFDVSDPDIITLDYRVPAPAGSRSPANLARRHSQMPRPRRGWREEYADYFGRAWDCRNAIALLIAMVVYATSPISPFVNGLLVGVCATVIYHLALGLDLGEPSHVPVPTPFKIPDYMAMPVLKVPETTSDEVLLTTTKCAGWMNELPDTKYNPLTYHIGNTQTVYVSLEGSTLRISHPKSKVQKRAAFDEKKYKLKFVHQRIYNIYGCKLELLPEGLTRKRLWSKKYPICVTLTTESRLTEKDVEVTSNYDEKEAELSRDPIPSSSSLNTLFVKDMEETSLADFVTEFAEVPSNTSIPSIMLSELGEEDDITTSSQEMIKRENSDDETFCLVDDSVLNEHRLFLFARADRQKEDWYRRFAAAVKYAGPPSPSDDEPSPSASEGAPSPRDKPTSEKIIAKGLEFSYDTSSCKYGDDNFVVDSARGMASNEYLEFMNRFHLEIPRDKLSSKIATVLNLEREVDCDVMWLNAIVGHILFDVLKNPDWLGKISVRIQKKLDTIKRPYFLEDIRLVGVDLGRDIPLVHRASRPVLDDHGLWVDLDVSFEGNICLTLETKLNLLKLKKQPTSADEAAAAAAGSSEAAAEAEASPLQMPSPTRLRPEKCKSPIFDSDLEDSAESSETEPEDRCNTSSDDSPSTTKLLESSSPTKKAVASGSKGVLRMMSKIVSSKYFQQAAENRYIKRAMEGVSNTIITLSVDIRGMTGVLSVNLPPPPSDRLWYGFRGNPRVWIKARPKFGDRHLNIKHVASWIEKKLVQEFQKKFVLPNMDDLVIPPMSTQLPV